MSSLNVRDDFPIYKEAAQEGPLVYLDSAATTLKPRVVIEAVRDYQSCYSASVHRSVHRLGEKATQAFEATRDLITEWIGASDRSEIVFTSGATMALNLAAQSFGCSVLKEGDEILLSHMEHHSNIVPWQLVAERTGAKIKPIPINDAGELDMDAFGKLLCERTKIVGCVLVSNSLGTINPAGEIAKRAHEVGAKVVLDGAQAMVHMPVNVAELDCDFLALSGHKMLAPTGCGVLYGKRALLEDMPPFLGGGDMIRSVSFEKTTYAPPPSRFEAGTPPIASFIGLGKAVEYIKGLGWEAIQAHEADLLAYGTERLQEVEGLTLVGTAQKKASILAFTMDGIHPHDIGSIVDQEGVSIRTGHHCTQPVMQRFGIPATARASLCIYNTREDIDALVAALRKAREIFA